MVLRTDAVDKGGEIHPHAPANFVPVQADATKFDGPGAFVAKGCGGADRNNPLRVNSRNLVIVSGSQWIASPPDWPISQTTCIQSFESPEFARHMAARWLSMRCPWR